MNPEARTCQSCKSQFTIESEDFDFYKKIDTPAPTFCPECRFKRRLIWRNEHQLYRRKDDRTGEMIFSGFAPTAPVTIWDKEYWISDAWDAATYGRDYDFSRSFFDQFKELMHAVPWPSRSVIRITNSDYCDQAGDLKNCYLCFNIDSSEECTYVVRAMGNKNCLDLTQTTKNELCYEGVGLSHSYKTLFSDDCENCADVWFSKNCSGCTNCFGCANLRGKSYCFLNEQLSKEEYAGRVKALKLDTWTGLMAAKKLAHEHIAQFPVKYFHGVRAVESSGDYMNDVKNVHYSFFVEDVQDAKFCQHVYMGAKDCYDYTVWGNHSSLMYEVLTSAENAYNLRFSFDCWPSCRNLEYCISCRSSSDCFGCVGLNKKQYCIFNKQYSKEEYTALREKIINQMKEMPYRNAKGHEYRYGEFFPSEFSPFGYNETMMQDTFPLTKEQALVAGYAWYDGEAREFQTTTKAADIPDSITAAADDILQQVIECASCKKAYRIVANELAFLKNAGVALPRECPNCRLAARFARINIPVFNHRACACRETGHFHGGTPCPNEFETAYTSKQPETVYCEPCYQANVN